MGVNIEIGTAVHGIRDSLSVGSSARLGGK